MKVATLLFCIAGLVSAAQCASGDGQPQQQRQQQLQQQQQRPAKTQQKKEEFRPLNIAHRGYSGKIPEHTVEAYQAAVDAGADFIECDMGLTKDLHIVCLHEMWLNATTDVSKHPEFADRLRTYNVTGMGVLTDYFSIDFTLAELKTLGKVQQHEYRDQSMNGKYPIATLEEYIAVAKGANRTVGIYPEWKEPAWVNSLPIMAGKSYEKMALELLNKHGYSKKTDPIFLQTFDENCLKNLAQLTEMKLIMLIEFDVPDAKLDEWAKIAYGVGPWKNQIVPTVPVAGGKASLQKPTELVQKLHSRGLKIHPYTFRNEDRYLAVEYAQDPCAEFEYFLSLGIDGFFTDFTGSLARFFQYKLPNAVADMQN